MNHAPPRPPLRGRSEQMDRVLDVLRRAGRSGQGAVVLVTGEAGIGKTALLGAAAEQAARLGFAVGAGRADESSARVAPLAALFAALRSGRSPLLRAEAFGGPGPVHDRELWLVDRLAGALEERAAGGTPVLIVVDDVQWADELSAFALRILPGRLSGLPIVWLLASRAAVTASGATAMRSTPLRAIVEAAAVDLPVVAIELGPLSEAAVEELAVDLLGAAPDERLCGLLRDAGGNPFLAVELLAGLVDESGEPSFSLSGDADRPLPDRLVVGVRNALAPLPVESLDLARAGAVLGQSFAADDVVGLVGGIRDRAVALPGLEPLVRAGILADDGSTISFRHGLLRQAVYADIPPTVRKAMHRAAARHLMSVGGKTRVVDAAAHVLASAAPGDLEAVDVLREAARGAAGMAPLMAADLIREAFALLAPGDGLWAEVGLETVAMLAQARRAQEAMTVADRLLALTSDASADVVARAEGLLTLPLWSMGLLRELRERAEKGLAAADLPGTGRARLLAQLALASSRDDDLDTARTVGAEALAAARQLGDASAEGTALWALGEIERNDGRNEIALGHFERLRDLAGTAYSADEILTLQLLDRYDASATKIAEAQRDDSGEGRGAGTPQIVVAFAAMWQAYSVGRLDDAAADAQTVLRLGRELGEYMFLTEARLVLSRVAQLRGDPAQAREQLELAEAIPRGDDGTSAMMLLFMRAWVAESEGDVAGALEPARTVVRETLEFRHRCRWEASWMVQAARIAVRNEDFALARQVVDMAGMLAARNPGVPTAVGTAKHVEGIVARATGADSVRDTATATATATAAAAAGHGPDSEAGRGNTDLLAAAAEVLRGGPRPLLLAEALIDFGHALLRDGDRPGAIAAFDEAAAVFVDIGATGELRKLQRTLRSAGVRRRWSTPTNRPTEGWAALTDAEKRVATLIAEGRTNKSVATELVLSPNTVATHLRAVFAKMGVKSRAQLARAVAAPNSDQAMSPG